MWLRVRFRRRLSRSVALSGGSTDAAKTHRNKEADSPGALGNPYLLRNFPGVAAYATTYSTVPPPSLSREGAFGKLPSRQTPVSIPGFARYGDGIGIAASSKIVSIFAR